MSDLATSELHRATHHPEQAMKQMCGADYESEDDHPPTGIVYRLLKLVRHPCSTCLFPQKVKQDQLGSFINRSSGKQTAVAFNGIILIFPPLVLKVGEDLTIIKFRTKSTSSHFRFSISHLLSPVRTANVITSLSHVSLIVNRSC
jgi:hypothetical protein